MRRTDLHDLGDRWRLDLAGWQVNRISLDFQFRLVLFYGPDDRRGNWEVMIESPFEYRDANGTESGVSTPAEP